VRSTSCVLVCLFAAILAACGRERPAESPQTAPPAATTASSPEEKAFLALLPVTGAATNWSQTKDARRYGPGNLWEYIDGAAEQYLTYGFQELASAGYAHVSTEVDATVDLYKMADAVNAFGIYAQELSSSCEVLSVGVEGCYAGGALSFWSGPYFVKLTAFRDSAEVKQALLVLAAAVAGKLGAPGAPPREIGVFPAKNLVPRSVKYVPKDVLGQSFLANAFEAQYQEGTSAYKLLVIGFDTPDAAADGLARYKAFIGTGGKITGEFKAPGTGGFTGTDSFYGTVCAARSGTTMLVALGVPSEKAGLALIQACVTRLR
jgi:hypothetical protein